CTEAPPLGALAVEDFEPQAAANRRVSTRSVAVSARMAPFFAATGGSPLAACAPIAQPVGVTFKRPAAARPLAAFGGGYRRGQGAAAGEGAARAPDLPRAPGPLRRPSAPLSGTVGRSVRESRSAAANGDRGRHGSAHRAPAREVI